MLVVVLVVAVACNDAIQLVCARFVIVGHSRGHHEIRHQAGRLIFGRRLVGAAGASQVCPHQGYHRPLLATCRRHQRIMLAARRCNDASCLAAAKLLLMSLLKLGRMSHQEDGGALLSRLRALIGRVESCGCVEGASGRLVAVGRNGSR